MANYYVSRDGKVSKDKKTRQTPSYRVSLDGKVTKVTTKKKKKKEDDIAPVKKTTGGNKNSWFKSGGFSDGVDGVGDFFGDLAQTTAGTLGDIGVGVGKGLTRLGEGIVDLGTYGVAGVADAIGKDKWADKTRKKAQKDWTSKAWKKPETFVDKYSVLGNKADAVTEGLGQVGGIILTGGIAGALGAGGAAATAISTAVTGLSSMGSGMSEAYQNKATDKEAFTYGAIAGTAEAATELLFGGLGKSVKALGISKGLSSADDMLAKKISSKFTNQIAKNFTEFGIKAGAEGTEEVLSGIAQAVGKKVTYMSDKELSKLIEDENLLDQFIVGSITSGIAQSGYVPGMKQGSLREANKSKTDFITGLTQNEQKVVDKEYENRIAEAEEGGKTLSKKEKNKIYDEVINDLEKGYISTDTIEDALGGETYKTYKSMEQRENEVRKEIEELENTPFSQITVKQQEKLTELRKQLDTMEKSGLKNKVKAQLSNEVSELAMASKLSESYNEKTRRGQAFQADLTKYDAKQQDVIKKATESGILNNTNRTHEFVDMVAKISADKGVTFDFTNNQKLKESGLAVEGKTVNGYVKDGNIAVNIDSNKSLNSVVGHEITHTLENTEFYTELQQAVKEYAKTKGEYFTRRDEIVSLYKDSNVENVNIGHELTADLVGDYLFTDSDFINNLSTKKPNIFQRIYNEIKYLCKIATAGSKEARQLEKVKRAFDKAYKESVSNNADTKTDTNTDTKVDAKEDTTKKYSLSEDEKARLNKVTDDGLTMTYVRNPNSGASKYNYGSTYGQNIEPAGEYMNMDELQGKYKNEGWEYGTIRFKKPLVLEHINTSDTGWKKTVSDMYGGKTGKALTKALIKDGYDAIVTYDNYGYNEIVNLNGEKLNDSDSTKNIQTDSNGKELTKEQQEFFKDSKVRDENGNLLEVYHGTKTEGINTFEYSPDRQTGDDFGEAYYFTSDYTKANGYSYDVDKDPRVKQYTEERERLKKEFLRTRSNDVKEAYKNVKVDGKDLYELMNDEAYNTGGEVKKVYLNLKNPLIVDAEGEYYSNVYEEYFKEAKDGGYDGIIVKNVIDNPRGEDRPIDVYIAFKNNQIKNVDNTTPTTDADIRYSLSEDTTLTEEQESLIRETNELTFMKSLGKDTYTVEGYDKNENRTYFKFGATKEELSQAFGEDIANEITKHKTDLHQFKLDESFLNLPASKDTEGRKLSKEQKEYFKNVIPELKDDNGNLKVLYHGTPNEFTQFNYDFIGSNGTALGKGFYLTDSRDIASGYVGESGKIMELYANIEKPLSLTEKNITKAKYKKFVKAVDKATGGDYLSNYGEVDYEGYNNVLSRALDDYTYDDNDVDLIHSVFNTSGLGWEEGFRLLKKTLGYDGVVQHDFNGTGTTVFVPTLPEQIKSVTNQNPTDNADIRFSLSEDEKMSHIKVAQEYFGTTQNWDEVGYITLDGKKLDFSGRHEGGSGGYREVDHRDIRDALGDDYGGEDFSGSLVQFMSEGNIRIMPESNGINLSVMPTEEQMKALDDFISRNNGEVTLDIDDLNGKTVFSMEYPRGTFSEKIFKDIESHFKTNGDNYISPYSQFRQSLSKQKQNIAPYGKYNVYGKDVALEQDIAPTVPKATTQEDTVEPVQEPTQDIAPITEEQANVRDEEQNLDTMPSDEFEKLVQSYMDEAPGFLFDDEEIRAWAEQQARENPQGIAQKESTVTPESPLDADRDIYTIGKERKRNAYMYENPEVKPFFQDEAQIMLSELQNSTKGERQRKGVMYGIDEYEIGASNEGWYGTKRNTSEEIAYLLDTFKYTYDDIEKGLKAIIDDHGAENNAVSKRIEFLLDDRLRLGYNDFMSGNKMQPNQDYINLLNEKNITEYGEEARNKYMQPDIAPVDTIAETTETVQDIAPVKEIAAEPVTTINENVQPQVSEKQVTSKLDNGAKQRKWIKTSTESKPVDKKILPKDLDQKAITYEPIPNKNTLNNANSMLKRNGYDESVKYFNSQFQNKKISLDDIALGERLIQEAVKKGDMETAGELIQNVSILGTELGQKVQALSIIQRLTPEGQLKTLTKIVERGKTKGDKTFEGVEITQEMIDKVLKTYRKDGTYSQEELDRAVEEVKQQIADQMKVTKMDKINAWRYLSMLGNPKTHVRNIISNVGMKGTMAVKDAIARTIETVAPVKTRTKTWKKVSDDVKEFSKQTTKEMQSILEDGGKYSDTNDIKSKRQIFKNKVLNTVFEFNNDMLSKEDWWFQGAAFNKAFSEYLTANGINTKEDIQNNAELIEKAKAYATEQSEIATFKQYSYIAQKLNEIESKNTATQIGVGAIVPFKKTPVNIAKAGLNYSPLGFMKTLTYDASQVKKGNMEASQMIDHLAQNMTGTGLALAGYMLAMSGFLNGAGEEDKEGKYDYQLGKQSYSVNIGGNTYSLSWLTPMAMPLFVGANAFEILTEGKEWDGNVVIESLTQTLDPMSEMSVLSGLTNVLSSYEKGSGIWADIAQTTGQNYVTQFVPTLSSQVATLMDDKQRSTKVAGNSDFKFLEETVNKLKSKIPGLRETLEPSTDVWGREVKLNENKWKKVFDTFLAPYSRKENMATQIDEELKDLYSDTGDGGLFPQTPKNSVNYEGEKYNMSAKEYTSFKKTYGQNALELMEELFQTMTYQNATATDKAEMVDKVYDYANDEAKRKYLAKKDIEFTNAKKDGEPYYKENIIKGAIENDMPLKEFDFYNENPEKYNFLQKNNVSYKEYSKDEDTREAYNWAFNNPEKYTLSKAISKDVVAYRGITKGLYNIRADKDSNGKTIIGSAKAKKLDYINKLDIDYGEKLVLFKSQYNSDDTYNYEIIDYLNSREDITYEEQETILKQLGFTVTSDGNVYWN